MWLIVACNMIGHVWTVDQDTHNTVTCEFYDREAHHQFFFTDPYLYDKACLSTHRLADIVPNDRRLCYIICFLWGERWEYVILPST